jgi:hypothetical protein
MLDTAQMPFYLKSILKTSMMASADFEYENEIQPTCINCNQKMWESLLFE